MEQRYYSIAGHCVELSGMSVLETGFLKGFEEVSQDPEPEIRVRVMQESAQSAVVTCENKESESQISFRKSIFADAEQSVQSCYGIEYFQRQSGQNHIFRSRKFPSMVMYTDISFQNAVIEGYKNGWYNAVMELLLVMIYSRLTQAGGLLVHASCIKVGEDGIIFTGPSGIGKTTQARLWEQYQNAEIMNGDKAILEVKKKEIRVWGSPWKGSSPYAVNTVAFLKAAVVLQKAASNRIRLLSTPEKFQYLTTNFFYPFWDNKCTEQCLSTIDQVVERLPVYLLSCKPEEEAVRITFERVWGKM